MKTHKNLIYSLMLLLASFTYNSCVQEDDFAIPSLEFDAKWKTNKTLKDLITLINATGDDFNTAPELIKTEEDFVVEGYVISSDEAGNFFETLIIQDKAENPEYSIQIDINEDNLYGFLPVGSKVQINTKGLYWAKDANVLKLGLTRDGALRALEKTEIKTYLGKISNEITEIKPIVLNSFSEINASHVNKLISVSNAYFSNADLGKTYALTTPPTNSNRTLQSEKGTLVMRNSGFADFASAKIPAEVGTVTGVLSRYNNDFQLLIRDLKDVNFTKSRPIVDGFETLDAWNVISTTGEQKWNISASFGNPKPLVQMSGFVSGASNENEDWLILKPIAISATASKVAINFESDVRFSGNVLEVYVSKNYVSGNPSTATWEKLNPTLDTDISKFNNWIFSGDIDITSYKGNKVSVAFKYTSTASNSATWQLDNFKIIVK
jgi:hypothetical protein